MEYADQYGLLPPVLREFYDQFKREPKTFDAGAYPFGCVKDSRLCFRYYMCGFTKEQLDKVFEMNPKHEHICLAGFMQRDQIFEMDKQRYEAVKKMVRKVTRDDKKEETVAALSDAIKKYAKSSKK